MELLDFLRQEGVSESILSEVEHFRSFYRLKEEMERRIPTPQYSYYGKEIWEQALSTLLAGENLLLVGPKATGKNVLAEGLSAALRSPSGTSLSILIQMPHRSLGRTPSRMDR